MTATYGTCTHRWRIESPDGPRSDAWCMNCGLTRTFQNSFDETNLAPVRRARMGERRGER